MPLASRHSLPEDKDFLFRLYSSTRLQEISAFGWDDIQKQAFLTIQFNAQQRWYETAYPRAEQRIVTLDGQPVGRMIVDRGGNKAGSNAGTSNDAAAVAGAVANKGGAAADQASAGADTARGSANAAVLVDISLLPEHRGRGLGTLLLRELMEECRRERQSLRLQVLRTNPAQRLYERLGFRRTGEDQVYLQMEWREEVG
jgi:ribosomal protein S18 acetylase RimI-like enzyme